MFTRKRRENEITVNPFPVSQISNFKSLHKAVSYACSIQVRAKFMMSCWTDILVRIAISSTYEISSLSDIETINLSP